MRREIKTKTGRLLDASDLTVAAPIKQGLVPSLDAVTYKTRAERVLQLLQLGRQGQHEFELTRVLSDAVERTGLIHAVRVGIIEPQNLLMLSVTFDGDWEPYMRVIWQKVSRLIDLLFCHTENYTCGWESSYDDWMRWLRSRQVNTPFLYAQPGLAFGDGELLRRQEWLQRDRPGQDMAARRLRVLNADEVEAQLGSGDQNDPRFPGSKGYGAQRGGDFLLLRQSVRAMVALHRLTDFFLPGTHDGWVLHRAARETLAALTELADAHSLPYSKQVILRFTDAVTWLSMREPDLPPARRPPALQAALADVLPDEGQRDVQAGILSPIRADFGCALLLVFQRAADMAAFLHALPLTHHVAPFQGGISVNVALSVEGLRLAGFTDDELRAWPDAFYEGMARRAGTLGDVRHNHPRQWRLPLRLPQGALSDKDPDPAAGGSRIDLAEAHALLTLRLQRGEAQTETEARNRLIKALEAWTRPEQRLALQWLVRLKSDSDPDTTTEHFGWRDAQSDPVFDRGAASGKARDHTHVGEALCGYANAVDHRWPPDQSPCAPWLRNGSFLVVRKLRQDVAELEAAVTRVDPPLPTDIVRAKLMGRWHDRATPGPQSAPGAPLADPPPFDPAKPNDFSFAGDPAGALCPFHAHIRRTNPRLPLGSLTNTPRDPSPQAPVRPPKVMRRGMSYGPRYAAGKENEERGLFFMAYNASLAEQFEVLQRWLSGANSGGGDSAQADALLGVAAPGRDRTCLIEHNGTQHRVVLERAAFLNEEPRPLVRLEWGGYWFAPALSVVHKIAARARNARDVPLWSAPRGEADLQQLLALERRVGGDEALRAWKEALEDPESLLDYRAASIWAAIRAFHGGVLRCAYGVLVADPAGVHRVVRDETLYSVVGYQARMRGSFGAIFLSFDAGAADGGYARESASIVDAIRALPLDKTFVDTKRHALDQLEQLWKLADEAAKDADDPETRLQFEARELTDYVIGKLCADWFGVGNTAYFAQGGLDPAAGVADRPRNPGHFASPSRYFFQPHPSDDVARIGNAHGQALRREMQRMLDDVKHGVIPRPAAPLLEAVLKNPLSNEDPGYAARTAVGVVMGFVPTVDGTLRRVLSEWLREGTFWRLRGQGLRLPDYAAASTSPVQAELVRAIQLRGAPELLWRTARADHWVGSGEHAVAVKSGDIVVAGLMSATQCLWEQDHADCHAVFGGDRDGPDAPTHACPGTKAGFAVMLGLLAALLEWRRPLRPGPVALSFEVVDTRIRMPVQAARAVALTPSQVATQAAARAKSSGRPVRILTLGDSWLAEGMFELASLTRSLRERGYECLQGYNLATSAMTLTAIANKAPLAVGLLPDVDLVLVDGGGNDVHKNNPSFFKDPQNPAWSGLPPGPPRSTLDDLLSGSGMATTLNEAAGLQFLGHLGEELVRTLKPLVEARDRRPVIVVAYDNPVPDGRSQLTLPWLAPAFIRLGLDLANPAHLAHATALMGGLITKLNAMVARVVAARFPGQNVHPISLVGTLDPTRHLELWHDELHPNQTGFGLLADALITKLP